MLPETIDPECFGLSSKLLAGYLEGQASASQFFHHPIGEGLSRSLTERAEEIDRQELPRARLAEEVGEFMRSLGAPQPALANSERLAEPGSLVVAAGQQTALFGGALMVLSKALAVLDWAGRVKEITGRPTIPLFWMPDWDHDFEEVRGVEIPHEGGLHRLKHTTVEGAGLRPVGKLQLNGEVRGIADRFLASLRPEGVDHQRVAQLLERCYRPGETFSRAFASLLVEVLGERGLVVVPASTPLFSQLNRETIREVIHRHADLEEKLLARSRTLKRLGFHEQVTVLPGETLVFLESAVGREKLIRESDGSFVLKYSGERFEPVELIQLIEEQVERFSPSALLKPVYQCRAIPLAMLVAGPAEVAYWAQAEVLFGEFGQSMPVVLPRPMALVISEEMAEQWEEQEIPLDFPCDGAEDWLGREAKEVVPEGVRVALRELEQALEGGYERLRDELLKWDPTLARSAEARLAKARGVLERIEQKIHREALRRLGPKREWVERIINWVRPGGDFMERRVSWLWLLGRFGFEATLERMASSLAGRYGTVCLSIVPQGQPVSLSEAT